MNRKKWTREFLIEQIMKTVDALHLDRMPSVNEINRVTGENAAKSISDHGAENLASELGLKPNRRYNQELGDKFEDRAILDIAAHGFSSEKMKARFPYDLLVEDMVKVEVKASHTLFTQHGSPFFCRNLTRNHRSSDLTIFYCLNDDDSIYKTYIIPTAYVRNLQTISVGNWNSKYDRFIDRWDILKRYVVFMKSECEKDG